MTQVNSLFVNDISRHNHNIIVLYIDIIDDLYFWVSSQFHYILIILGWEIIFNDDIQSEG
jgi:hypothetical protein